MVSRRTVVVLVVVLAVGALLAPVSDARAEMCTIDQVPAATLLLPYFEVDLAGDDGVTTLFAVGNASAAPTFAHVTIWSNFSIPILDFDIYLTGYDIQTVNLRDVLLLGNLPLTGSLAGEQNPVIDDPLVRAHFQTSLIGNPSPVTGDCAGLSFGDEVARGYVTIDDVNLESLEFPGDPGYFISGGNGIASNDNQLWGDFFIVEPNEASAQGGPLVHIEAEDGFTGGPNGYTFYARYAFGGVLEDEREPLPTTFAVRFLNGAGFDGGTDLLVWRDSTRSLAGRLACGGAPAWFPLAQTQIVVFDEEENPVVESTPPVSGVPEAPQLVAFPLEAQRTTVGGPDLPVPFENGWLYLDLNQGPNPFAVDPFSSQSWVEAVYRAEGRYSLAVDAIALDSACDPLGP